MSSYTYKTGVYDECLALTEEGDMAGLMKCAIEIMESKQDRVGVKLNNHLLVLSGALVFFMQAGFAMLCAGSVRKKNTQNTMLKNLLDACGAAISFFCIGYALAFGGDAEAYGTTTFIGTKNFFGTGNIDLPFFFFQYTFSAASVTIVAGALAERCQMAAYLAYSFFLTGFVYPVIVHAIWSVAGFLSNSNADPLFGIGMIDFAGSAVVHVTGGSTALVATYLLGSRRGRFFDERTGALLETPKPMRGHSVSLQVLGTFILWFGWFGFNSGSALLLKSNPYLGDIGARCAVNTFLASSTGCISALIVRLIGTRRQEGHVVFDMTAAQNGALTGMVAITAGCATLEMWAALLVGLVAGVLYLGGSNLLIHFKMDDVVDAIPVHFLGGVWGCLAVGLLSEPELTRQAFGTSEHPGFFYSLAEGHSDARLLACQMVGILFVVGWTLVTMVPFFLGLNAAGLLRTDAVEELVGLDMCYNDILTAGGGSDPDDAMRDEYILAYEEYRLKNVNRKKGHGSSHRSDGRSVGSSVQST